MVPYSKLLSFATRFEVLMCVLGHVCAALIGMMIPLVLFLFGDAVNSFGPDTHPDELLSKVQNITFTMIGIAFGIFVIGYLNWSLLAVFANRVT